MIKRNAIERRERKPRTAHLQLDGKCHIIIIIQQHTNTHTRIHALTFTLYVVHCKLYTHTHTLQISYACIYDMLLYVKLAKQKKTYKQKPL